MPALPTPGEARIGRRLHASVLHRLSRLAERLGGDEGPEEMSYEEADTRLGHVETRLDAIEPQVRVLTSAAATQGEQALRQRRRR